MLKAWLRRPDMLPLRGGWQATGCARTLRQKHKNNLEMEGEQKTRLGKILEKLK